MGAPVTIDTSLPISTLLREGTKAAHEKAEKSEGAAWLLRGELDREEYVRFLMMLWHVYDMLETALEKYANLPALAGTYNPHLLGRSSPLSADIAHMLSVSESEWQSHPVHTALLADSPQPLTAYTSRLRTLADTQPALLLAHSYVRYLGDLSGGQFIKRRIAKAYGLDVEAESGSGVEFYSFGSLEGARIGNMGDMKKVKEWFREGMDSGVGSDPVLKSALVQEANVAFELNTGLFSALRPPTATRPPQASILTSHLSPTPAAPPLGDPSTPGLSSPTNPFGAPTSPMSSSSSPSSPIAQLNTNTLKSKEIPIEIVHGDDADAENTPKTYSVATIATFILAVGLAHFFLITGKWVGTDGWLSQWFPDAE